jgi:hypothetical protein
MQLSCKSKTFFELAPSAPRSLLAALAGPPFNPPSRPSATAAGFLVGFDFEFEFDFVAMGPSGHEAVEE